MTYAISLNDGFTAFVDDLDAHLVEGRSWRAETRPGHLPYAYTKTTIAGKHGRTLFMHRVILGIPFGDVRRVDHVDGDVLNNRRSNLRIATTSQNQANRKRLTLNTSGFRGVTLHKRTGRWQAALQINGKSLYLGLHDSTEAAAKAYDAKALEVFGEYANVNFPVVAP